MSPSYTVDLKIKPPINGLYYSSNDKLSGTVHFQLNKSTSIKKILVNVKGFTETMTQADAEYMIVQNGLMTPVQDNKSYHTLLNLEKRVFPPDNVWNALEGSPKPFKVNPGEYNYEFEFDKLGNTRPACLKNHFKDTITFLKRRDIRLPPSFNLQWQELNQIGNLDLHFYSFGKIIYIVQVLIEFGKPKSWFKPFDKVFRKSEPFEFIPDTKYITYPEEELAVDQMTNRMKQDRHGHDQGVPFIQTSKNQLSLFVDERGMVTRPGSASGFANSTQSSTASLNQMMTDLELPLTDASGTNAGGPRYKTYKSSYKIGLPDNESTMWLECRNKDNGFKEVFRLDPLFKKSSNKFDQLFLVFKGNVSKIQRLEIVPTRMQLNLIETTTYLSHGIANENFSSLRLAELNITNPAELFNINELSVISQNNDNTQSMEYGKAECELRLKDHPSLKRLLFNEEDYKHRGNRLYSFKTCTIKRVFEFQLLIDWDINGVSRQTDVIISNVQIFNQVKPENPNAEDFLPRYVEPPVYNELDYHITESVKESRSEKKKK